MPEIQLKKMEKGYSTVRIRGISPLVTHRMGPEIRAELLRKKQLDKTKKRIRCEPEAECKNAAYELSDGSYGFKAVGVKKAIIAAADIKMGLPKTYLRKWLFVEGDEIGEDGQALIRIDGPDGPAKYTMNESVVKVGMGATDLRFRPLFWPWSMAIRFEYVIEWLQLDSIVNLIEMAGYGVGLGEDRPEKQGGGWGRFEIEKMEAK